MKKNKMIIIALILIMCALICSQLSSIFANTNYITSEKLTYKELSDGTSLISGFEIGTKVSEILNDYFASDDVEIFDNNNNNITNESDKVIGTGDKIIVKTFINDMPLPEYNNITDEVTSSVGIIYSTKNVVIYGDTNGDGSVDAVDALIVVKNKLGAVLF